MSDNITSEEEGYQAGGESQALRSPLMADIQHVISPVQSLHDLEPSYSRRGKEPDSVRETTEESELQSQVTRSRDPSRKKRKKESNMQREEGGGGGEEESGSSSESPLTTSNDVNFLSATTYGHTSEDKLLEEDRHAMKENIYRTRGDGSDSNNGPDIASDIVEEQATHSLTPTVQRYKAQYRKGQNHQQKSSGLLSRSMIQQQGSLPESSAQAAQRDFALHTNGVNGESMSDLVRHETSGRKSSSRAKNIPTIQRNSHDDSDGWVNGPPLRTHLGDSRTNNTTSNYIPQTNVPSEATPEQRLDRPLLSSIEERNNGMGNSLGHEVVLPRWQPDTEVDECPICDKAFSFFSRKHHCRRCGRVVCNACSPHRITIPYQYIVQPPSGLDEYTLEHVRTRSRTISQSSVYDPDAAGGMKVRLCNPCVPDPNISPPTFNLALERPLPPLPQARSPPPLPPTRTSSNRQRVQRSELCPVCSDRLPPSALAIENHIDRCINRHLRDQIFLGTPTQRPSELSHSSSLPLTSHTASNMNRPRHTSDASTLGNLQDAERNPSSSHTASEAAPSRPFLSSRMICFTATKLDTVGQDSECIICMEDFETGVEMARLECLCKYHKTCIDGWFFAHPGRCPVHGQDNY